MFSACVCLWKSHVCIWIVAEMRMLAQTRPRVHVVDIALTIAIVFKNVTGKVGEYLSSPLLGSTPPSPDRA